MPRLRTLGTLVRTLDTATTRLAPKRKAAVYDSPQFREWRRLVVDRAGRQCEHVNGYGLRCTKAAPLNRMFADHITEVRDGGALLDPANGQCLCGQHHTLKTIEARSRRFGR